MTKRQQIVQLLRQSAQRLNRRTFDDVRDEDLKTLEQLALEVDCISREMHEERL